MTINKRKLMHTALAAITAITLASCGKKEETKPAEAPKATEPLKVGFIYVGPVGDAGWTFAHDNGRKHIEEKFGDKIKTSFVEKVPEGADAERVIRDLVFRAISLSLQHHLVLVMLWKRSLKIIQM